MTSPLDTACPLCGAAPWVSCRGRVIPVTRSPHVERIVASAVLPEPPAVAPGDGGTAGP